jgi:hypothetical protein
MPTRYTTKGSKYDKHGWSIDGGEADSGPHVGEHGGRIRPGGEAIGSDP